MMKQLCQTEKKTYFQLFNDQLRKYDDMKKKINNRETS